MRKTRNKKSSSALLAGALLLLHSAGIFFWFLRVPLNSDHANQVLEAADILSGNIFLKGWNLTGVSFYLSELPWYELATAIKGIDPMSYHLAASAMVIVLSLCGFFLAFPRRAEFPLPRVCLYLALTGFPTLTWLGYLRGHCAIFIYFFLLLFCWDRLLNAEKAPIWLWLLSGLLTACGCMSDMQLFIIGVLPLMLFALLNLLRTQPPFGSRRNLLAAGTALGGTVLGLGMDAALMKLGAINKNSFLDTRKFVDMERLGEKARLLGKGILTVFRVEFPLTVRSIFGLAFTACVLALTLYCLLGTLRRWLRGEMPDAVSVLTALSLCVMILICFFTDIYTSDDSARYIAYLPFAAAVLVGRNLERVDLAGSGRAACIGMLAAVLAFVSCPALHRVEAPQDRLAAFLEENGLVSGYASFWNASHTTVASQDRVRVRSVRVRAAEVGKPDYLAMQNWFCKTEWYSPEMANFIALDGSGYLDVREDYIRILLGEPDRILDNGEYRLFIYNRDISQEIIPE